MSNNLKSDTRLRTKKSVICQRWGQVKSSKDLIKHFLLINLLDIKIHLTIHIIIIKIAVCNVHTSIAHWIKNPLRETSEHNNKYK